MPFDNVDDTLTFDRRQVFDFEVMRAYPALLERLLFYLLHRVTERIQDPVEVGTLEPCVPDEAWRFIQHPTLRASVQEALKTWRKRNAAMSWRRRRIALVFRAGCAGFRLYSRRSRSLPPEIQAETTGRRYSLICAAVWV